jgi:hypothetical protein
MVGRQRRAGHLLLLRERKGGLTMADMGAAFRERLEAAKAAEADQPAPTSATDERTGQ